MAEPYDEREPLDVAKLIRETTIEAPGPFRLRVMTARQFSAIPDPENVELLGPLVSRSTRTIVVGDTGHGKTSLCLQIVAAIVKGDELLEWQGAGVGPLLVVDLEQGERSIKRGLRESKLDDRDDVLYASVPDGLALDQEREHLLALLDVVAEYKPVAVLLDPYYKAHRADDPNAERPIIDLMRTLDSLRAVYGFALILPAHPRKDIPGREGARKLTLHDVAGSGAVTRGAEVVVAIERLSTGAARLRYLKDRDGDLPVGEFLPLLHTRERGFYLDEKAMKSEAQVETAIVEEERDWMTVKEWSRAIKAREGKTRAALERLVEREPRVVWFAKGPPGRSRDAQCFTTIPQLLLHEDGAVLPGAPDQLFGGAPEAREHPGAPGAPVPVTEGAPGAPGGPLRPPENGSTVGGAPGAGAPLQPGDPDYPFG